MAVGELGVIETQAVQNGGLHVVDVRLVFNAVIAQLVGLADDLAAFDASAGQQHRKAERVMVAALVAG